MRSSYPLSTQKTINEEILRKIAMNRVNDNQNQAIRRRQHPARFRKKTARSMQFKHGLAVLYRFNEHGPKSCSETCRNAQLSGPKERRRIHTVNRGIVA